ncbi:hypothetical protein ACFQHV_05310 [Promicromonospora thailandica]|uniref:Uncharacterized protein n=1 Tax=Promicromonospora thailandica TaxID=765201 RepID=A0A9X2G0S0_9MICO|nr:hypothetical protein [Promicromonospora thailandica]MCP2263870.1 hypothetical protein [Promicromonospora thailandica]BFF17823.1 hypothetical protein GCM10025730_13440 [Promicromonospora thailandica]
MGIRTDYFAAPTDEVAATVLSTPGGPTEPDLRTDRPRFDAVALPSVDPFVMLGGLAGVLSGRPYGEVTAHPRHGALVGARGEEGPWVVSVAQTLVEDLASAGPARLAAAASDWAGTAARTATAASLAAALLPLAALAARAADAGHGLYCWTSLTD